MAWFGQTERAHLPGSGGDEFAAFGEVAGEEQREAQLGELAGLEVDRADAHPDARAAEGAADAGDERQQQQHGAEGEEGPLVAGEVGRALDHDEGGDVGADGDEAPRGLQAGEAVVEPGDHHVADAVQQCGEGEQGGLGAAGQQTGSEVGQQQQAQQGDEERHDDRRDLGVLTQ